MTKLKRVMQVILVVLSVGVGLPLPSASQTTKTFIAGPVVHADGTPAQALVTVHWATFTTATGIVTPAGQFSTTTLGNELWVRLTPNAGATPIGSYYIVTYAMDDGYQQREYWVVPDAVHPVTIDQVRYTVLPISPVMQMLSREPSMQVQFSRGISAICFSVGECLCPLEGCGEYSTTRVGLSSHAQSDLMVEMYWEPLNPIVEIEGVPGKRVLARIAVQRMRAWGLLLAEIVPDEASSSVSMTCKRGAGDGGYHMRETEQQRWFRDLLEKLQVTKEETQ